MGKLNIAVYVMGLKVINDSQYTKQIIANRKSSIFQCPYSVYFASALKSLFSVCVDIQKSLLHHLCWKHLTGDKENVKG